MKQFLRVLKFELNNYLKNKSFITVTILLALLAIGGVAAPTIYQAITGESEKTPEIAVPGEPGREGVAVNPGEIDGHLVLAYSAAMSTTPEAITQAMPNYEWEVICGNPDDNMDTVKEMVDADEVDGGFVMDGWMEYTYVVKNRSMQDSAQQQFHQILKMVYRNRYLATQGVDVMEFAQVDAQEPTVDEIVLGKDGISNYFYTYVMIFILYFLIIFYGQMIATSVTTEKSNRAIEILVTSVNSTSLIFGKVLAGAIAGVAQVVLILGGAVFSYRVFGSGWDGMLDFLFNIPGYAWLAFIVFGMLGYLLYAFIFGMLGALVSKTEDISKSATPVTIVFIVAFFITMFSLTNVDSMLMKVASYVPFTSFMAMLARVAMGGVAVWELILSVVLLAGTCLFVGWLAAKIFRFGTLMYGNPIKLTKAIRQLKNQK